MAFLNNLKRASLTLFYEMVDLIQRKNVWTASLSCQTLWIKKMSKLLWLTSQAQKMLIEWLDKILLNSCHCKIRRWSLKIQWNFAPFYLLHLFRSMQVHHDICRSKKVNVGVKYRTIEELLVIGRNIIANFKRS